MGGPGWCPLFVPRPPAPPLPTQVIVNKLWLGWDLSAAIAAPILHVDDEGRVEFEPGFPQVRPG